MIYERLIPIQICTWFGRTHTCVLWTSSFLSDSNVLEGKHLTATCACPQESGINLLPRFSGGGGMVTLRSITGKVEMEVHQPIFLFQEGGTAFSRLHSPYYGPDTVPSKWLRESHSAASAVLRVRDYYDRRFTEEDTAAQGGRELSPHGASGCTAGMELTAQLRTMFFEAPVIPPLSEIHEGAMLPQGGGISPHLSIRKTHPKAWNPLKRLCLHWQDFRTAFPLEDACIIPTSAPPGTFRSFTRDLMQTHTRTHSWKPALMW